LTEPRAARGIGADLLARLVVGALFAVLSANLLADFARTQRITGLLLLVSESLVVVLTIFRRRTRIVDRSAPAAIVTAISLVGPALLRTAEGPGIVPDLATAVLSALGLIVVISGKITLGRSFGIAPANRGVVVAGPYTFVRHPIYAGYLMTHLAFGCAHPTVWNLGVLVTADAALMIRALYEERVLASDRVYQTYCRRVAWHVVPGLF
jgi:protein-S-isoprenylcysteine O-methyltransferase Ste14